MKLRVTLLAVLAALLAVPASAWADHDDDEVIIIRDQGYHSGTYVYRGGPPVFYCHTHRVHHRFPPGLYRRHRHHHRGYGYGHYRHHHRRHHRGRITIAVSIPF